MHCIEVFTFMGISSVNASGWMEQDHTVNTASGNGFVPDGNKSSPESMLTTLLSWIIEQLLK